jgi:hypothetical protein
MLDRRGPIIRSLDESDRPQSYWRYHADHDGSDSFVETVTDDGQQWAVKQLVVEDDGTRHHYWWRRLGDAYGFLGDQALDESFPGLEKMTASGFLAEWNEAAGPGHSSGVT